MATITGPIRAVLNVSGCNPMSRSLAALSQCLGRLASDELRDAVARVITEDGLLELAGLTFKGLNLFSIKMADRAADGALEFSVLVEADRGYLELVSAVALNINNEADVTFEHGWPILSVVCGNSTVAEAGGAASLSGGSATPEGAA